MGVVCLRVLLDTHTLIWWILDDPALTQTAREAIIADTENTVLVSAASAWELAIKFRAGKLPEAGDLVSNFPIEIEQEGFQLLPISAEHGIRAGLLPGPHKDPFDRMLIAQSRRKTCRSSATKRYLKPTASEGFGSTDFSLWIFSQMRPGANFLRTIRLSDTNLRPGSFHGNPQTEVCATKTRSTTAWESRCGGRDPGNAGRRARRHCGTAIR